MDFIIINRFNLIYLNNYYKNFSINIIIVNVS